MVLFGNGNPQESLVLVRNLKMVLKDSVALAASTKIQYLCTLFHGEALCQLDTLSVEVVIATKTHLNCIFLGLCTYFFLLICCQRKSAKCAVERGSPVN